MKQKLSILLAVILLLSLFAGCTPADVPSTGDSSVDASLSETDIMISETNTDASTDSATSDTVTDTSTDSVTTDIYTNIGTSTNTESSEPAVKKTTLTMEDLRTIVYGVTFEETTFDYFDKLFGNEGQDVGLGSLIMEWDFDNFRLRAYPINADRIKMFGVVIQENVYYDMKTAQDWLLSLGIDVGEGEGALEHDTYYLISLPQKKIKVRVLLSESPHGKVPAQEGLYLWSIYFAPPDYQF